MTRALTVRRSLAAVATAPLLLAGLAACGGDSGGSSDPTAADPSTTAPAATAGDTDLQAGDKVEPADFADTLEAGMDNITTAHASVKGSFGAGGSLEAQGDVDYTGDSPAAAMKVSSGLLGSDDADVRLVDGAMYLNLGQLSQGKFWKVDLDDPQSPLAGIGSQLDPKSTVEMLEKGLDEVTYDGEEDGLDHYEATVDTSVLTDALGKGAAGAQLPDKLDYDVWLDDESRLNRLSFGLGDLGSIEMSLSDFGADVSVEAPPADEITEMPSMFSSPGTEPQV